MDYRIFNVHMWSFLCMNIHTGVGHTDSELAQDFDSEKLSQIFLVLWTGFEPLIFGSRVDALQIESPRNKVLHTDHTKQIWVQIISRLTFRTGNYNCPFYSRSIPWPKSPMSSKLVCTGKAQLIQTIKDRASQCLKKRRFCGVQKCVNHLPWTLKQCHAHMILPILCT